ncbi:MAG: hypothetical protein ABUT20_01235, partial [Bacteroidota bacterium]
MNQATNLAFRSFRTALFAGIIFLLPLLSMSQQQLKISDFAVFGGNGNCPGGPGQTPCNSPGCSVMIGSGSLINGGSVGSYRLVTTSGTVKITGNIYSGGTVSLDKTNTITGKISAANSQNLTTTILSVGTNSILGGNIDVKGNIVIGSGSTVSGIVTHTTPTNYSGPTPGGNVVGTPTLPVMPLMPPITSFPAIGSTNITGTKTIGKGVYKDVNLGSNATLTLSGPGVYVFKSLTTSGPNGKIVFDFQNQATGNFFIYVQGDIVLSKTVASIVNGGSANRIFTETHGGGSSDKDDKTVAFNVSNGSNGSGNQSIWFGTVWAPYAAIKIGSPTGPTSVVTGALWSGTQVNIQSGVTVNYAPFVACNPPTVSAGADKTLDCTSNSVQLSASASPGVQILWTAINGGKIDPASATSLTPTVTVTGTYILTATDPNGGCTASDTTVVTNPCIMPFYPPPPGGKMNNLIGSELNSLYFNFGKVADSAKTIFIIQSNSTVQIEVIAKQGQYSALSSLLRTAPYGLTDTISNGPNTLIISGKFPIANLKKLDSLPTLIDYVRPLFPAVSNGGITTTQGDISLRTDLLRNGYALDGTGVKVGVLSDSYNTIPGDPASVDVGNGDLPGADNPINTTPVQVVGEYPFGAGLDEGRAMLQIIHDIAPKATLAFRTGFVSAGDMAMGIRQLKQANCDVMVDDVTFITEPFLQDGVVAQAVNEVAAQ